MTRTLSACHRRTIHGLKLDATPLRRLLGQIEDALVYLADWHPIPVKVTTTDLSPYEAILSKSHAFHKRNLCAVLELLNHFCRCAMVPTDLYALKLDGIPQFGVLISWQGGFAGSLLLYMR